MPEQPSKTSSARFTKKRVVLFVAVALFVAVIGLSIAVHDSTPMPVYQGKTAREWAYFEMRTNTTEARQAFEKMGSNAVPFLVYDLARKESTSERLRWWIYVKLPRSIRSRVSPPLATSNRRGDVAEALSSANSRTAIPLLLPVLAQGEAQQQWLTLRVLLDLLNPSDTNCVPALMQCLDSTNFTVAYGAFEALEQMNLEKLAIPSLANFATGSDAEARMSALQLLARIDSANEPKWSNQLTRELTLDLKSSNQDLLYIAVRTVEERHSEEFAIATLTNLIADPDIKCAAEAYTLLESLDETNAAKWLPTLTNRPDWAPFQQTNAPN